MLPFQTLLTINKDSAAPVYQQIANGLVGLIRDGVIKPGAGLPGSRELALILQVHRKTIVAAYQELFTQDWIETIPRKGVIVSQKLPEIKPRSFKAVAKIPAYAGNTGFPFQQVGPYPATMVRSGEHRLMINDGFPDHRIAPIDMLMREYRSLFHSPGIKRYAAYGSMSGPLSLRTELTGFLSETRGLNIGAQNILLTHGAQMSIYIAARLILKPGATVLVGDPNYFMADMIFQQCGAKLQRIPLDEQGMDVDAIAAICKRKKPDLLYIIPHHHHPTTVTLSAERRMKLLELIRQYRFPVIEDDYDYDFHYGGSPILPLASADHDGNVIYIGSLTKSLATFMRVGYMVAPENFIQEAAVLRRIIDIRSDNVLEEALATLFRNGDMQRHLKKSVKLYHERRDHLCNLLDQELKHVVKFHKPAGGMAVWAQFDKKYPLPAIAAKAAANGLLMSDGASYSFHTHNYNALRMGFASLNEKELSEVVEILKKLV
ncbi:PLP-dependent aminotransferase family protein [Chitinophaga agrisoli]|uniref:PLP-dependent aminotransferase family protein n=1 Tax=Chitinophaga agrisoli TaxID=2607653 RepID=A0A5B2VWD8_9BACT|nr:PLP-dependent aminotransferase family protein [Chitinophaga agrisoli]KAA2242567.1 PLP-dependent aminotransferase family protein [Chitinophaga agrisoli]